MGTQVHLQRDYDESHRFSWNLRKLIWFKVDAMQFIKCEVKNGSQAMFWFDNWAPRGPLISMTGKSGPRQLRIARDAKVFQATSNGDWKLASAMSDCMEKVLVSISEIAPSLETRGHDIFLWKNGDNSYSTTFSSRKI